MKNNLNLTLSNIIYNQSNIVLLKMLRLQDVLLKKIETSQSVKPDIIYKCPRETIHHSLVNFLPPKESSVSEFEVANYKKENWDLIVEISLKSKELLQKVNGGMILINSVYMDEKSIALEAFPSEDVLFFANRLAGSFKIDDEYPKVKGFPVENPQKFPINIIRFFRPLSDIEEQMLNPRIAELNEKIKELPIEFKLEKLSLVVSDLYLANPHPEIAKFDIK